MDSFLLGAYKTIGVILFLLFSMVLLYHRLIRRWVVFSVGFFVLYARGSYLFFEVSPIPVGLERVVEKLPYFLFFFGATACVGMALLRQYTVGQTVGVSSMFLFLLLGFSFVLSGLAGTNFTLPRHGSVQTVLKSLPRLVLYVGLPVGLGAGLRQGAEARYLVGSAIAVVAISVLVGIGVYGYFGDAPEFASQLGLHIGMAALGASFLASTAGSWLGGALSVLLVLGLPVLVAVGLRRGSSIFIDTIRM